MIAATVRRAEEAASIYTMPRGDFARAPFRAGGPVPIPFRSPTPDAELQRLKREGATAPAGKARVVVPAEIGPKAVFQECVTNGATGFAPSDIHGAVGPQNFVVVTNVDIGVYRKATCGIVSRIPLRMFFGAFSIPTSQTLFDPRVLFDRGGNRCLVTAESRDNGNTDQFLYVAASTTKTCTSWRLVRFALSRVSPAARFCKAAATDFYDYPNAGYNRNRLVVTSNNFGATTYGTVLSIDKAALYSGAPVSGACFRSGLPTNLAPAVVGDGNPAMYILSPGAGAGNAISRLRLTTSAGAVGTDTLASTPDIAIPAWSAAPNAAQPNGELIDTLDGRFQSASKQIAGNLWNVHSVNDGGFSRWRLYKLSTTGTSPLFTFTPTTSECASTDHLFNPSVDTNSAALRANAFVTASRTCPRIAGTGNVAHLIFTGANASAAGWAFNLIETSAFQYTGCGGGCRWGDYSSTQIDPLAAPGSPRRAWGFNQLVTGTSQFNWNTRAAKVGP